MNNTPKNIFLQKKKKGQKSGAVNVQRVLPILMAKANLEMLKSLLKTEYIQKSNSLYCKKIVFAGED